MCAKSDDVALVATRAVVEFLQNLPRAIGEASQQEGKRVGGK